MVSALTIDVTGGSLLFCALGHGHIVSVCDTSFAGDSLEQSIVRCGLMVLI